MDLNEVLVRRRSVREYTAQAIDEATIRHLIATAVLAPSAVNQQPWTFTVVRDQCVLDRISAEAKCHMLETMAGNQHADRFRAQLTDPKFQIFHHAPVLVVISANEQGPWIVEDCALAAENLMLAACDSGLGTCWIGFARSFLNTAEGKRLLGLSAACVPVAPIIVGHPKVAAAPVPRVAPVIRWV